MAKLAAVMAAEAVVTAEAVVAEAAVATTVALTPLLFKEENQD